MNMTLRQFYLFIATANARLEQMHSTSEGGKGRGTPHL